MSPGFARIHGVIRRIADLAILGGDQEGSEGEAIQRMRRLVLQLLWLIWRGHAPPLKKEPRLDGTELRKHFALLSYLKDVVIASVSEKVFWRHRERVSRFEDRKEDG